MDSDDNLRARFRALATEDVSFASEFSRARIEAHLAAFRARRGRRAWYSAGGLAVAGAAAVVTFAAWPKAPPFPFDLSNTTWTAPTDFLLNTPGSALLRTVPAIGFRVETQSTTAAPGRGDTSGRDK